MTAPFRREKEVPLIFASLILAYLIGEDFVHERRSRSAGRLAHRLHRQRHVAQRAGAQKVVPLDRIDARPHREQRLRATVPPPKKNNT